MHVFSLLLLYNTDLKVYVNSLLKNHSYDTSFISVRFVCAYERDVDIRNNTSFVISYFLSFKNIILKKQQLNSGHLNIVLADGNINYSLIICCF